ncbi:MAG: hypothetical protein H0V51_09525 [Chloroflexi bacterium]|nr:hypothetical protein [Chloroflexota bacterium]
MTLMRFTVVDTSTTVSFIGPARALPALVAACAGGPQTLDALLTRAATFTADLRERVLSGLAVFDEHNGPNNYRWIHAALDYCERDDVPVFRVVDDRTRELSLSPVWAGVVVFNLQAKRIVQIQNTYAEIKRKGSLRVIEGARPTNRIQRYELPAEWSVVPEP